ncbi:MAG: replication restart helicase PriA [Gemmatimonadota bacterium]
MEPGGLVEVALPLPVHRRFTYRLQEANGVPPIGGRVVVGFGRRRMVGFAVGPVAEPPAGVRLKPVLEVLDAGPVLSETEWRLALWMAQYYVAPIGLVLRLFFPPGATYSVGRREEARAARREERLHVLPVGALAPEVETERREALDSAPGQMRAWEAARLLDGPVERADFCRRIGVSEGVLRALAGRGFLEVERLSIVRDPLRGSGAVLPAVSAEGALTGDQGEAVEGIRGMLAAGSSETALLQGVTGSGKTRVYVEAVEAALDAGGRAIVLVPEIGLAAPVVSRFRDRFGERLAVLHSGLSDGERFDAWMRIREGEIPIVIGARSALFAPVDRAALIVVDEEHEGAYKQDETPRYHARDVAVVRAALEGGVALLGSATPSLESRANAESGKYRHFRLDRRIAERPLPEVEIVSLARKRVGNGRPAEGEGSRSRPAGGEDTAQREAVRPVGEELVAPGLSARLAGALSETLAAGDQALLFLNRRGFSAYVQCLDCGWVAECPDCRISLTYHRDRPRLLCHYCGYREPVPDACPACRGRGLDTRGLGTQQVERAVSGVLPEARVARMDVDTTRAKWSHARIYRAMQDREIDILVGTQMIAKGFDLPGVALVGVVSADTALHLPDFRASERTFQLLVQVAGRAGRGDRPGRVLLQTWMPTQAAIVAAAAHDYEGFYRSEVELRRGLGYPPGARLANVVVSGPDETSVARGTAAVDRHLRDRGLPGLRIVGPAPCPLERLRGRTRHHLLLKSEAASVLDDALWELVRREGDLLASADRLEIDRDPMSLL